MDDTKMKYVSWKDAPNINTVQKEEDCPNTNVMLKYICNTKAASSEEECVSNTKVKIRSLYWVD